MKQQELADTLKVSRSTVAMWETGKSVPRASVLLRMTDILHCTVDELLRGPDETVPEAADERAV